MSFVYPASITENGIVFDDNSTLEADIIVLATGYKNMKVIHTQNLTYVLADEVFKITAVKILGKEAEKMGEGDVQPISYMFACLISASLGIR